MSTLLSTTIPDFIARLQADLDAATSNLAIAQQQTADLQARVDQLTSDIGDFQSYVTMKTQAIKFPPVITPPLSVGS